MRLVIINLFLCGTSGTFFWYPVLLKTFGYVFGLILLFGILLTTYFTCMCIIEASYESQKNDYMNMIGFYLGKPGKIFSAITFLMDYFSTYVIGLLICYNILLYILYYSDLLDKDAVINFDLLEFD